MFKTLMAVYRDELTAIKLDQDFPRLGLALGNLAVTLGYWNGLNDDYEDLISFVDLFCDTYGALSDGRVAKHIQTLISKLDDMI